MPSLSYMFLPYQAFLLFSSTVNVLLWPICIQGVENTAVYVCTHCRILCMLLYLEAGINGVQPGDPD